MESIYRDIAENLQKGEFLVLATIIKLTGSGPRGVGTKCLVKVDGSFLGTIGGGVLEATVLKKAENIFKMRLPDRLSFSLKGTDVANTDMLCGGDTEIFLEPLAPEDSGAVAVFKNVSDIQKRGGSGIVAILLNTELWEKGKASRMFLGSGGQRAGSLHVEEGIEEKLAQGVGDFLKMRQGTILAYRDSAGRNLEFFVEPVAADPVLYVFGAGHVSSKIVPVASMAGFKVVVVDDRPDFADPGKFPEASKVYRYSFEGVMEKLPVDESSFLVIVTRGHIHDKVVLAQALKTKARYIGMIGSRRKVSAIFERLKEEGFSEDDLKRVHAPIGLEIGAETPEEIAISIVAELIKVRAFKD